MKIKEFGGRKVVDSVCVKNSIFSLQVGNHTAMVVQTWKGKKTIKSKRETVNHDLIISGPKSWDEIFKRFNEIKGVVA